MIQEGEVNQSKEDMTLVNQSDMTPAHMFEMKQAIKWMRKPSSMTSSRWQS